MGLLTPAFLAGLAALAIPLIIHLIRRERRDAVEFPSLMFLSRIPQPVVKRRRIRNWWLFALRCIALVLLVSAFARPFVDRSAGSLAATETTREVVILLDRSYSMSHGDRWSRARASAHEAVDGLAPGDRASLVVFDAGARMVVQPTADRARLRTALDSLTVSAGVTKYTPALKMAQSVLAASELDTREAVLISDFQRTGWDGAAGAQLPAGAVLRPVHITAAHSDNVVVTGVTLNRARISGRERITPIAQIANRGESAVRLDVVLEMDGRTVQSVPVDIAANATRAVELQPVTLGDQAARGTVRAGRDALAADNAFHFVLEPDPGLRVLIVQPDGRDASLYLRRALDLGEDPPFVVTQKRALPTAAELERADIVLLNDVLPADGDAGRRLVEWVRLGGGLVIGLGDRTADAQWNAVARELAGGATDRVVDRVDDGGARLGYLDYSHPVFELFRAPRAGGFGAARFYRYRPVPVASATSGSDTTGASSTVLARFDDGAPALVERALGEGRVLIWGTTFDAYWSNLALEPIYLPLLHQLVRRGAGFEPPRQWTHVGQVVDVAVEGSTALVVNAPGGSRIDVADNSLVTLDEQGFYEVREARAGGPTLRHHAVNVDVTESDLAALDPAEVAAAVTAPVGSGRSVGARALAPAEQEQRQALWWYLLIVVFGLLITEAVMANRRTVRPATR